MRHKFWHLISRLQILMREEGQDLVEYALVVALISLAATAGMTSLASNINSAFSRLATTMSSYTA